MIPYRFEDAKMWHARAIQRRIGDDEALTLKACGLTAIKALRGLCIASSVCETALIGERPVAMWGLVGTLVESRAEAWLAITPEARARGLAVMREARDRMHRWGAVRGEISATVDATDTRALRFAQALGFEFLSEETIGDLPFLRVALRA